MANASHDDNFVPTLLGVSSADGTTPTAIQVNPATGRVLMEGTFTSDGKLKVSANDTTPAYPDTKFVAGTSISLTENNDGANETLTFAVTGLVIGTDVQAFDATLTSLAALGTAGDKMAYATGVDTWAETNISAFGRSLIDDADAATARTTLGLGTIATQAANSVSISGGSITGITDLTVADGGTGVSTLTAYAVMCGGTTTTNPVQSIAGVGTANQVLTSNGAGALPTFQAPVSGGNLMSDAAKVVHSTRLNVDNHTTAVSGTAVVANATWGLDLITGGTASSVARLTDESYFWSVGYDQNMSVRFGIHAILPTNNSTIHLYGLLNGADPNAATKYVGIRTTSTAGTDVTLAVTKDGSTEETTDISGDITLSGAYNDILIVLTANTDVKFYLNGTLVATHSTNIPPVADTTTTVYPLAARVANNADTASAQLRLSQFAFELTH